MNKKTRNILVTIGVVAIIFTIFAISKRKTKTIPETQLENKVKVQDNSTTETSLETERELDKVGAGTLIHESPENTKEKKENIKHGFLHPEDMDDLMLIKEELKNRRRAANKGIGVLEKIADPVTEEVYTYDLHKRLRKTDKSGNIQYIFDDYGVPVINEWYNNVTLERTGKSFEEVLEFIKNPKETSLVKIDDNRNNYVIDFNSFLLGYYKPIFSELTEYYLYILGDGKTVAVLYINDDAYVFIGQKGDEFELTSVTSEQAREIRKILTPQTPETKEELRVPRNVTTD